MVIGGYGKGRLTYTRLTRTFVSTHKALHQIEEHNQGRSFVIIW